MIYICLSFFIRFTGRGGAIIPLSDRRLITNIIQHNNTANGNSVMYNSKNVRIGLFCDCI